MKKKIITILIITVIALIIGFLYIFNNNYLMFKLYYSFNDYDLALEQILQLDNTRIIELTKQIKVEKPAFAIDILTSMNEPLFSEENFNIYVDILENTNFDKDTFDKIIQIVEKEDSNFESIISKQIIYKYCCSYIEFLNKSSNLKEQKESQYDEIIGYLKKIEDFEDSTIKLYEINFDMATYFLDLGKNSGNRYDLMLEYFDKIDSKYLTIIDPHNIVNIANIYFEIAEKYTSVKMYAYAEPYYEKAINILKSNENENIDLINKYELKLNEEKNISMNYKWCEAYGCAREKSNGHPHYCTTHQKNSRALTPVHINTNDSNSEYSTNHKCEYPSCNNYASKKKYCTKHTTYDKCSKNGCSKSVSYSGAKYCIEHEIELYNIKSK